MIKINLILLLSIFSMFANAVPDMTEMERKTKIAAKYQALKGRAERGEKVRVIAKIVGVEQEYLLQRSGNTESVASIKKKQGKFERAHKLLKDRGFTAKRKLPRLGRMVLEVDSDELDQLIDSGLVEQIVEDIPEPPHLVQSISHVQAELAHADGFTGANQAIVILDSGVEFWHPFFSDRLVEEACFSSNTSNSTSVCPNGLESQFGINAANDCSSTGIASCDHGTHVAGIAAGSIQSMSGIAPSANIVAVQVFSEFPASYSNCNGRRCILSYTSDQLAALEWVLNDATTDNIAAINMSIGGGSHTSACDSDIRAGTIQALRDQGIATIISSGNDSFSNSVGAPGCISAAITVGSTRDSSDTISSFSNSNSIVDILAPGSSITSSIVNGVYGTKSGTSMAAPHITGAFAVLREINPNASVDDIELSLESKGVEVKDTRNDLTFPRLDLYSSVISFENKPIASLDEISYSVIVNRDTQFSAYSSSDPNSASLTYIWDFGDGSGEYLNTSPTAQHTYTDTGTFSLNLGVSNSIKESNPNDTALVTVYDPVIITVIVSSILL